MYDLILKQAKLIDGKVVDIAVANGKIAEIGSVSLPAKKSIDLAGKHFVSAGWIDAHAHVFELSPIYHDEPDLAGVAAGVTTVIDAGSVGADEIDRFYQITRNVKTNVYAFLNISRIGVIRQNELADMADIDQKLFDEAMAKHPDFIVGLKARMSKSVVGENGITPLVRAKEMQKKTGLPLMIHIGNNPPDLDDIADLLTKGDIITHCFNGKPNRILNQENTIRDSIMKALSRGVVLDVGHGGESFSFKVAERAKELGIYPMTISSDIYSKNRLNGPVYSLANVMTKFLCIDYTKQQILDCVTSHAAEMLHLKNKGQIKVGFDADFTIFDILPETITLSDSEGTKRESKEKFVPLAAIVAGETIVTKEGEENGLSL
ncbi:amidohydrolase/deacetylase family metallohydrolase [Zophobihabitans entericus]|uniref:Amidohydrolase/deacetylase family metallohydrolase n=1 Tax=Zophobihabitans entericus TaxID=1635327 RepID=A0A6G9I9I1_9GAMM|nr:amidohydrolase/deacetylase family metallohydrolase [Zophobihabitans entericus]QIQ20876.1 amidohydrolase/deacetylase family metallohydrolase [Zophobihabitans entericus]